jgi:hypothetical protein
MSSIVDSKTVCNRKVCHKPGEYTHRDNGQLYCHGCACSINAACEEEVVLGLSPADWRGTHWSDHLTSSKVVPSMIPDHMLDAVAAKLPDPVMKKSVQALLTDPMGRAVAKLLLQQTYQFAEGVMIQAEFDEVLAQRGEEE